MCAGRAMLHRSTGCLLLGLLETGTSCSLSRHIQQFILASSLFKACSHDYSADTGVLTSPNYPNPYPVDVECIYTITVAMNKQIVLYFTNFTLEGNRRCTEDYVEIRQAK